MENNNSETEQLQRREVVQILPSTFQCRMPDDFLDDIVEVELKCKVVHNVEEVSTSFNVVPITASTGLKKKRKSKDTEFEFSKDLSDLKSARQRVEVEQETLVEEHSTISMEIGSLAELNQLLWNRKMVLEELQLKRNNAKDLEDKVNEADTILQQLTANLKNENSVIEILKFQNRELQNRQIILEKTIANLKATRTLRNNQLKGTEVAFLRNCNKIPADYK